MNRRFFCLKHIVSLRFAGSEFLCLKKYGFQVTGLCFFLVLIKNQIEKANNSFAQEHLQQNF